MFNSISINSKKNFKISTNQFNLVLVQWITALVTAILGKTSWKLAESVTLELILIRMKLCRQNTTFMSPRHLPQVNYSIFQFNCLPNGCKLRNGATGTHSQFFALIYAFESLRILTTYLDPKFLRALVYTKIKCGNQEIILRNYFKKLF